ncbi:MAG: selenide, water dikinase SelD, partial [Actinomadura rubrobrunea]|nr:selenide, water dikinase SelD [Actinomadura rubrobrunea]
MTSPADLRLTQYAHGGGGAGKLPPGELEGLISGLTGPAPGDGALLLGADDGDDAAVLRLDAERAVVSTVDVLPPIVDDPYDWGRIAAANALSDVYAVGARPVMALNLLGWPRDVLPAEIAQEVLRGGRDTAARAGCAIA